MKKKKITIEYAVNGTTQSIFRAISTANGLSGWFADYVDIKGNIFVFFWNKAPQTAMLMTVKENSYIRFHWSDEAEYFFEFRIIRHEFTDDNTLIITDFVDADEQNDAIELWNNQVEKLKRSIGCAKN